MAEVAAPLHSSPGAAGRRLSALGLLHWCLWVERLRFCLCPGSVCAVLGAGSGLRMVVVVPYPVTVAGVLSSPSWLSVLAVPRSGAGKVAAGTSPAGVALRRPVCCRETCIFLSAGSRSSLGGRGSGWEHHPAPGPKSALDWHLQESRLLLPTRSLVAHVSWRITQE